MWIGTWVVVAYKAGALPTVLKFYFKNILENSNLSSDRKQTDKLCSLRQEEK